MQTEIPRGIGKGHWEPVLFEEYGDKPHWSAIVWCPECGKPLNCVNHTIAPNGQISPSLGHPAEYPPCAWHTHPRLVGWEPKTDPPPHPYCGECTRCGTKARSLSGWGRGWGFTGDVCPKCVADLQEKPNTQVERP
jgi:hypothetical protein